MNYDGPTVTGTRDELAAELESAITGWKHYGKPELADQALDGRKTLLAGESDSVTVGHTTYTVR